MSKVSRLEKYKFSQQELKILELISKGYSNKQIADKLNICLSTFKTHLRHIYHKVNLFLEFEKQNSVLRVRAALIYLGLYNEVSNDMEND